MQSAILNMKVLKAANLCASKEQTRYYLGGVHVEITARQTIYAATNGHVLFCHREEVPAGWESNTLLGTWIIPSAAIDKLKYKGEPIATLTQQGEFLVIAPLDQSAPSMTKPVDGTFPDFRRVVPMSHKDTEAPDFKNDKPGQVAQFAPQFVAIMGKVAKEMGLMLPHIHHCGRNPAPVTFGAVTDTFGIIMPVKNTAETWNGVAWLKEPAALKVAA